MTCICTYVKLIRKDYGMGTLHYNWPMSVHALRPSARTLQHVTVPIRYIYQLIHCTNKLIVLASDRRSDSK